MRFQEYMSEERLITRSKILLVAIYGAFAGAILMFMFVISGIVL
jgi:hypothetical protein